MRRIAVRVGRKDIEVATTACGLIAEGLGDRREEGRGLTGQNKLLAPLKNSNRVLAAMLGSTTVTKGKIKWQIRSTSTVLAPES
jgi:hypothetical protein